MVRHSTSAAVLVASLGCFSYVCYAGQNVTAMREPSIMHGPPIPFGAPPLSLDSKEGVVNCKTFTCYDGYTCCTSVYGAGGQCCYPGTTCDTARHHCTQPVLDFPAAATKKVPKPVGHLPKYRYITQSEYYVRGCLDYFVAYKYTAGHCYQYYPSPGVKASYKMICSDDGTFFTQTNYIDDGCGYVKVTFNVTVNSCDWPGPQWPSIFQCVPGPH